MVHLVESGVYLHPVGGEVKILLADGCVPLRHRGPSFRPIMIGPRDTLCFDCSLTEESVYIKGVLEGLGEIDRRRNAIDIASILTYRDIGKGAFVFWYLIPVIAWCFVG